MGATVGSANAPRWTAAAGVSTRWGWDVCTRDCTRAARPATRANDMVSAAEGRSQDSMQRRHARVSAANRTHKASCSPVATAQLRPQRCNDTTMYTSGKHGTNYRPVRTTISKGPTTQLGQQHDGRRPHQNKCHKFIREQPLHHGVSCTRELRQHAHTSPLALDRRPAFLTCTCTSCTAQHVSD